MLRANTQAAVTSTPNAMYARISSVVIYSKQESKKKGDCVSDDVYDVWLIHCSGAPFLPLFHQPVNLRQEHDEKDDPANQKSQKKSGYVFGDV